MTIAEKIYLMFESICACNTLKKLNRNPINVFKEAQKGYKEVEVYDCRKLTRLCFLHEYEDNSFIAEYSDMSYPSDIRLDYFDNENEVREVFPNYDKD